MTEIAYIISDTHLAAGRLDVFDQDVEIEGFVKSIAGPGTTLFLNGDFVDFVRVPPFEVPDSMHLLWDEKTSLQKLEKVVDAHPICFVALQAFIRTGGSLTLIIGNHDLDFTWPAVQERLRFILGRAGSESLRFIVGASEFHGVHVEHGHEFTPENCPRDPRSFFHEEGGRVFIERVWGTDFMLRFYNQLETTHPYADKVRINSRLLWYAIKGRLITITDIVRLLVFLKGRGLPWRGIASSALGTGGTVEPGMLTSSFADPEWQEAVRSRLLDDPSCLAEVSAAVAQLSPSERSTLNRQFTVSMPAPDLATSTKVLGLFRESREIRAARERLQRPGIVDVVFGHTHKVVNGHAIEDPVARHLYNPGSWLPCLDLESDPVSHRLATEGLTLQLLNDESLYTKKPCAVRLTYDSGAPPTTLELVPCA
jgi:hypothetical protein